jgi:hypothetical protein
MRLLPVLGLFLVPWGAQRAAELPVITAETFTLPPLSLLGSAQAALARTRRLQALENPRPHDPDDPWAPGWHPPVRQVYHSRSERDNVDRFLRGLSTPTGVSGLDPRLIPSPRAQPPPAIRGMLKEFVIDPKFTGDPRFVSAPPDSLDPGIVIPLLPPYLGR